MKKATSTSTTKSPSNPDPKSHKNELIIGSVVVLVLVILLGTIAILINNNHVKVVYQPTKACDEFTTTEAQELLGQNIFSSASTEPALSGTIAISKCVYNDGSADKEKMIVAAVMFRSGVNDDGVELNKSQFTNSRSENSETVNDLGESAYFNKENGLLNILDGYNFIIISYGQGTAQETNTLEDAVKLAEKVLN